MSDFQLLLLGGGLTIIGGMLNDELRAWRERSRERKAIQVAIIDELSGIEATIKNMHEVWENAKVFPPNYIAELLVSTSVYESLRTRLFLISDEVLRKELVAFYKKLKDTAKKTEGKIGTLAESTEATAEQNAFVASFQSLGTEAKQLKDRLEI